MIFSVDMEKGEKMYSVITTCELCTHDTVCSKKEFYSEAQKHVCNLFFSTGDKSCIGICDSKDIQVTVSCPHYLCERISFRDAGVVDASKE